MFSRVLIINLPEILFCAWIWNLDESFLNWMLWMIEINCIVANCYPKLSLLNIFHWWIFNRSFIKPSNFLDWQRSTLFSWHSFDSLSLRFLEFKILFEILWSYQIFTIKLMDHSIVCHKCCIFLFRKHSFWFNINWFSKQQCFSYLTPISKHNIVPDSSS